MRCSFNVLMLCSVLGTSFLNAQNPIIQTSYTADPAPMVHDDKLYLYTSHDEDNSTWFTMDDWRLYTTEDMVNWTDHGAVLEYTDNQNGIGVAVSDSPYGPFIDPLGKPLVSESNADIDPAVFIDYDGQAYMFWGNPECYFVKLNEDMISTKGDIQKIPNTIEAFGKRKGEKNERRPTTYEEGPWVYKRNDIYYLFFAAGPIPEHIGYSTSKSVTGPWK